MVKKLKERVSGKSFDYWYQIYQKSPEGSFLSKKALEMLSQSKATSEQWGKVLSDPNFPQGFKQIAMTRILQLRAVLEFEKFSGNNHFSEDLPKK